MDQVEIKEKLYDKIRPLVNETIQAVDLTNLYMKLGSRRLVTILRELMDEDKNLSQSIAGESERKLMDIKIAKSNLDKVFGGP